MAIEPCYSYRINANEKLDSEMTSKEEHFESSYKVGEEAIRQLFSPPVGQFGEIVLRASESFATSGRKRLWVQIDEETFSIEIDMFEVKSIEDLESMVDIGQPPVATEPVFNGIFPIGPREIAAFGNTRWELGSFSVELTLNKDKYGFIGVKHTKEIVSGMRISGRFPVKLEKEELDGFRSRFRNSFCRAIFDARINGATVREDYESAGWNIDDERYQIRWSPDGPLKIFSDGVFVKEIPREKTGLGGDIMMTERLPLNREGNDIAFKTSDLESLEQRIGIELAKDPFGHVSRTDRWEAPERDSIVSIALRIMGDNLDPDEVTKCLGREADKRQFKGQVMGISNDGSQNVSQCGCWTINMMDLDLEEGLEEALLEMMENLSDDSSVWSGLTEEASIDLFVDIYMGGCNDCFSLSPKTMRKMGERGIRVMVDVVDRHTWEPAD